jgi:ribosomal protein S18 acetylase RimI-like enzyme
MSPERFDAYREVAESTYAENIVASGMLPPRETVEKAAADFDQSLPGGVDTPGHELWVAIDADEEVGIIWLAFVDKSDGTHAFGYDFAVTADRRRRGYGRAIATAAEQICRDRGVVEVGLSVFGFNTGAQALYDQLGFEVTSMHMRKRL